METDSLEDQVITGNLTIIPNSNPHVIPYVPRIPNSNPHVIPYVPRKLISESFNPIERNIIIPNDLNNDQNDQSDILN